MIFYARSLMSIGIVGCVLCACATHHAPAILTSLQQPVASIQELMQAEVDTSADGVWNAVETVETVAGTEEHQPRTPEEWNAARNAAITLVEAVNLLVIDGRLSTHSP